MYLGITSNRRMRWRHHIKRTVAKTLRMYIYVRAYFLFSSWPLSTNIKLVLYEALIRSAMIYACPTLEETLEAPLLKLLSHYKS
jgi:hypothetical protein